MKQLLKYYSKKRLFVVGVITAICLILSTVILLESNFVRTSSFWVEKPYMPDYGYHIQATVADDAPLGIVAVFASILVVLVPIFEFYFKMRKISIDQMYSLPINRKELYLTKYLVGLIEIIIPLTITYIYIFLWVILSEHMFSLIYFLPYYFVLVLTTAITYTIFTFIYTRANTFFDGIINMTIYAIILPIIMYSIDLVFETNICSWFFIHSPIASLTTDFNNLLMKASYDIITENITYRIDGFRMISVYTSLIFLALSIVCGILFYKLNPNDKAENSQELSNSKFLYKTTIPLTILGVVVSFGTDSAFIISVVMFITGYLLYAIYQRSFKISWKVLLMLLLAVIGASIISGVLDAIDPNVGKILEQYPY